MSDILSQHEIDALLSALTTGEIDVEEIKKNDKDKKVKIYDFKNPNKFSKDQLRTLDMLHENFSRLLQTFLSAHLRTYANIDLYSVDQMSYHEFINSIPNPSIISIVRIPPLKGSIMLEMDPNIAFSIIDRLLGGPGIFTTKIRGLTEIEETIIKKVINKAVELIGETWKHIIEIKPAIDRVETNSQFAQLVAPNETVAILTFATRIGSSEGMINICLPHIVIEPIVPKLSAKFWFQSPEKKDVIETKGMIEQRIQKANLQIVAELGNCNLTIRDFLELQVGDVIKLDNQYNKPVNIYIDNQLKFIGVPGVWKKKRSIKITGVLKEGDINE